MISFCWFQLGLERDAYFTSQVLMEMLFTFSQEGMVSSP